MVFKGTKTRTAQRLTTDIEDVGGSLNAYTSRETTAYHARLLKQDMALGIEIIADMIQNSTFPEEEWTKECEVIQQEIGQAEDTPDDIIFDYTQSQAYPDHALGRAILGTQHTVSQFTPEHLRSYLHAHYHPGKSVFVISGAVNSEHAQKNIEQYWKDYSATQPLQTVPPQPAQYQGGEQHIHRDLEQMHIVLGYQGVSRQHMHDRFTMSLLNTLLGGGMSSRLFQNIREKQGWVYSIYSFYHEYEDTGFFGIYAGTRPQNQTLLARMTRDICHQVVECTTEEELQRAKNQTKAALMMGCESPAARCEMWANHMLLHKKIMRPQEICRHIDAINTQDIQNLAANIFASPETYVTLGPQ